MPTTPTTTDRALVDLLGATRARIVELLHGQPQTVAELAAVLDLSQVAVRRHLRLLEEAGLVEGRSERPSGRGRPGSRYALTARAGRLFPDHSATLARELLTFLAGEDGEDDDLAAFLAWRRRRQGARYAAALTGTGSVSDRVEQLAEQLTADGYQAGVETTNDGQGRTVLRLTQEHCAIRAVAAEHPELCGAERDLFAEVLEAPVTRTQTQAQGSGRCVCEIPVQGHADRAEAPPGATDRTEHRIRPTRTAGTTSGTDDGERDAPRARPTDNRSDDGDEG